MATSAWRITDSEDTPAGRLYTLVLGQHEWKVIHAGSGYQCWNGTARCEIKAGVRAAILDYEREHPYDRRETRRLTTTMEDIAAEALRTGFEG